MASRLPSLRRPPIAFAHRGASAHAPENTLEAFRLALRLGATGLETDVHLTSDGVPVLHHDPSTGPPWRRRRISRMRRSALPGWVPSVDDLLEECGTDLDLSVDVKQTEAAEAVVDAVSARSPAALPRLWLCHPEVETLTSWRERWPRVRLVNSTRLRAMTEGTEQHAARLQASGIDAVNLRAPEWTGGLTTLFHRFELYAFGWDAQHQHQLDRLIAIGIDALYSDHVDRMVDALERARGSV